MDELTLVTVIFLIVNSGKVTQSHTGQTVDYQELAQMVYQHSQANTLHTFSIGRT